MARKTTITSSGDDDEPLPGPVLGGGGSSGEQEQLDDELRPSRLVDVVGQRDVVERLMILLEATKKRREPLGHLLLDGPPGLGKTTLATVIPRELGTDIQITAGPSLNAPKDLLPYLTNASHGSVLFIDEIHRMPPAVEEFIYPAMEDFRVDITLGEGLNARTINMKLQHFTVIGATTRSGMLTAPLRDRFVNREHLDFYTQQELATIILRNSGKLRTHMEAAAADEIAMRSRGTPRKANNWLRWTRDFADARADGRITLEVARAALKMKGVDEAGLEEQDRRYLETIISVFGGGPAGVQAIGHTMNIPADTLEDEVEPFLLRDRTNALALLRSAGDGGMPLSGELLSRSIRRIFGTREATAVDEALLLLGDLASESPQLCARGLQGMLQGQKGSKAWSGHKGIKRLLARLQETGNGELSASAQQVDALCGNPRAQSAILARISNPEAPEADRLRAILFTRVLPSDAARGTLLAALNATNSPALALASFGSLQEIGRPEEGVAVVGIWKGMAPVVRAAAIEGLAARPDWIPALLSGLESGEVAKGEIGRASCRERV